MARRRLLTGDERRRLFDPPADQAGIIANYTLSADDIEEIGRRYGALNRLGLACHIALMRHPGFGLPFSADVPSAILGYLAAQLSSIPRFSPPTADALRLGMIIPKPWQAILV